MATNMQDEKASDVLTPLFGASITMIVLATFFFALRYVSRILVKRVQLGPDDLALLCAYVANVGLCSVCLEMYYISVQGNPPAHQPLSRSLEQIQTQLKPFLKCQYALIQLVCMGLTFPKLSLLFMYLRVFALNSTFRFCTYAVIGAVVVPPMVLSLSSFFACHPVEYFWDKTIHGGHCLSFDAQYRWGQGFNAMQDILVLILPLYPLWKLQAPVTKKLGWSVVFMTGGMGLVAGLIKWVNFLRYTSETVTPYFTSKLITWVVIESPIYLIACCIAGSGPLFVTCTKYLQSNTYGKALSYLSKRREETSDDGLTELMERNDRSSIQPQAMPYPRSNSFKMDSMGESVVVTTDVSVTKTKPRGETLC